VKKFKFDEICEQIMEQMMSSTVFGAAAPGDQGGTVPGRSNYAEKDGAIIPKILGAKKGKRARVQRRSPITTT
jgi:hypothetical protein